MVVGCLGNRLGGLYIFDLFRLLFTAEETQGFVKAAVKNGLEAVGLENSVELTKTCYCDVVCFNEISENLSKATGLEALMKQYSSEYTYSLNWPNSVDGQWFWQTTESTYANGFAYKSSKVKLEDLQHNSNEARSIGSNLTQEQLLYWKEKYAKAKEMLLL